VFVLKPDPVTAFCSGGDDLPDAGPAIAAMPSMRAKPSAISRLIHLVFVSHNCGRFAIIYLQFIAAIDVVL
jgi:hypothetical protein